MQGWTIDVVTAAFIGAGALVSATRVRAGAAVHASVTDTRQVLNQAASAAEERDQRAAMRHEQLFRVTVKMAWVAGLTLAAAIITLAVTIVRR